MTSVSQKIIIELAGELSSTNSIEAIKALKQNGSSLMEAKRAIERALERGRGEVLISSTYSPALLSKELARYGFKFSTPLS